jgi:hypothetical protein
MSLSGRCDVATWDSVQILWEDDSVLWNEVVHEIEELLSVSDNIDLWSELSVTDSVAAADSTELSLAGPAEEQNWAAQVGRRRWSARIIT